MDPNGLGRNIAYASQAAQDRFTTAALHPDDQQIGGPSPDPAWDALWGALHNQEGVPAGGSLSLKLSPAMAGLHTAMAKRTTPTPDASGLNDPSLSTDALIARGRAYTGYKG